MRVLKFSSEALIAVAILLGVMVWVYRWALLILAIGIAFVIYERRRNRTEHKECHCPDCRGINQRPYPEVRHRHYR